MEQEAAIHVAPAFRGFPDFRANVTFVPIQFFTVVVPHSSRGCVRIVGFILRKLLGWVDENGEPTAEKVQFTYGELAEQAGIARASIAEALAEALDRKFLECICAAQPDRPGQASQRGVYRLRWATDERYTDKPVEFGGFYYPASALVEGGDTPDRPSRAKPARKNIPNAFFDHLLPRERLAVIRVVGALLFYSIQWGPGGERRVPVQLSITQLSRLTRLSRQHTHEAVREAISRGYIQQIEAGQFDPRGGVANRTATYGIRWSPNQAGGGPDRKGVRPALYRPEKVDGTPGENGARQRAEKVNGNRMEKVNDISIKREHKTDLTTAGTDAESPVTGNEDVVAVGLLVKAGFSPECARRLAGKRPLEVIRRQLEWLPLRNTTRNRLGLLRRAIEQDWARPESGTPEPGRQADMRTAGVFAQQYYAAYHGYSGEPATNPFARDLQVARVFVERLLGLEPDEARVPEWGRQFGQLIRAKLANDPHARPYLSAMLGLYGNEFLRRRQHEVAVRRRSTLGKAREAHQAAFQGQYNVYLGQAEIALQSAHPALYAAFLDHRRQTRHSLTGGVFLASAETLARFDGDASRLASFAEYFHRHAEHPVPDFWEWDTRYNPQRFGVAVTSTPPEARA